MRGVIPFPKLFLFLNSADIVIKLKHPFIVLLYIIIWNTKLFLWDLHGTYPVSGTDADVFLRFLFSTISLQYYLGAEFPELGKELDYLGGQQMVADGNQIRRRN